MSKFKLTQYKVITEPIDRKGRRILLSTRSGRRIVIAKGCHEYLLADRIDEIPENILTKLRDVKAVVPIDENELETIVNENKKKIDEATSLYEVIQPSA